MLTRDSKLALGIFFALCVVLLSMVVMLHMRVQSVAMEVEGLQTALSRLEANVNHVRATVSQDLLRQVSVASTENENVCEPTDSVSADVLGDATAQVQRQIERLQMELDDLRKQQDLVDSRLSGAMVESHTARVPAGSEQDTGAAGANPWTVSSAVLDKLSPGERENFKTAVLDVLREKQLEDTYRNYMQTAEQMVKHYTTWLDLSSQQQAEVSSVVYRQYQELYEIQFGSKQPADRSTVGALLNETQSRHFDEIAGHLEPVQLNKFNEWRQARNALDPSGSRKATVKTSINGQ